MAENKGLDIKKILKWQKTHECTIPIKYGVRSAGPVGEDISVTFTPTTIGTFVNVECFCGAKLDVRGIFDF